MDRLNWHRELWVFRKEIPFSPDIEQKLANSQIWHVNKKKTRRGYGTKYKIQHMPSGAIYTLKYPENGELKYGFVISPAIVRLFFCWFLIPYILIMIDEFAARYGIPWDAPLKSLEGNLYSFVFYAFGGLNILFAGIYICICYSSNQKIYRLLAKLEWGFLISYLTLAFLLYPYTWILILLILGIYYSWRVITGINKAHLSIIAQLTTTLSGK